MVDHQPSIAKPRVSGSCSSRIPVEIRTIDERDESAISDQQPGWVARSRTLPKERNRGAGRARFRPVQSIEQSKLLETASLVLSIALPPVAVGECPRFEFGQSVRG